MPIFLSFFGVHAQRCAIHSRDHIYVSEDPLPGDCVDEQRAPGTILEATCQTSHHRSTALGKAQGEQYKGLLWMDRGGGGGVGGGGGGGEAHV